MPEEIEVILPDGSRLKVAEGSTGLDIANQIGRRIGKDAVAIKVNHQLQDLNEAVPDGSSVEIVTENSEEGLAILRHSCAHVMAQAVQSLYPGTKLGIGPAIENGFYYDFDIPATLTPQDLAPIEDKMNEIIKQKHPFVKETVKKTEAIAMFEQVDQNYKVELIEELPDDTVTIYRQDSFFDLCKGPHVPSTSRIKAFKLLSLAGAYWRGDVKRPMLQRIYGTAFISKQDLDGYLERIEEAKKRDHRVLGKQLDLFSFHDEGPGFPFFHPNGMIVLNEILSYWRKHHIAAGYKESRTPILLDKKLWERSGHWDNYRDNMYFTKIDEMEVAIKPMNCPGGLLIYKTQTRSYRDLPFKLLELGQVHRHELSGVLHGLFRVRSFIQDDAHIFCTPGDIEKEVMDVISLTRKIYEGFGFKEWELELSTKPEKSIGETEMWHIAEVALTGALEKMSLAYKINPGDGAFYGPKIDFHITDSMGRRWQCATIQLDFAMPERFDLEYMGSDNQHHRPVMIHRAILGSVERFFGILVEHYGGAFPAWLSPVQVVIIPIADRHIDYGKQVFNELDGKNIRVELDDRREQVGYKIRDAQLRKIPYMLVVGDKEENSRSVAVRDRELGDIGSKPIEEAIETIANACKQPAIST